MPQTAPYGGWRSPLSAAAIAAGDTPLGQVSLSGQDVYWTEGKPLEGGRNVLIRRSLAADGDPQRTRQGTHAMPEHRAGTRQELTPPPFNVRTRVHEYGGGAYLVAGSTVFFSNFADQRLYRQINGGPPEPITPEPAVPAGARYADAVLSRDGRSLICVRELHTTAGREATNELVSLPIDGSTEPRVLASGHDFYAFPRLSPDGRRLAFQTWDHPRMPWDGSDLWVADLAPDGSLAEPQHVAGGPEESIFQPEWSPAGALHFVSDRSGWWNLYRLGPAGSEPLAPMEAEFGTAQWVFGLSTYTFLDDGRIACIFTKDGFDHLAFLAPGQPLVTAELPYTAYAKRLVSSGDALVFVAASATEASAVIHLDLPSGRCAVLARSLREPPDPRYLSTPRPITFPTTGERTAHALYYPPANADYVGPAEQRPPLIVKSHGGPTSMASAALNLDIQFWTSRGFGLVDVNYGGSTGYGRAYRQRLQGTWGIVDTEDCINAARYLAAQGEVDGRRLAIRGGSAGGYTTLCALVFHTDFAAGASYYGVADCEALATDTHKFESRYLDGLIGPYPEAKAVYRERSPIHFADRLSCPVILFQGLEDRVVPPAQAEAMVAALRAKGLPYAYLAFEGEQHGFRKAETIQRCLEAELYFYSRVFGFPLAEPIAPVPIESL